MDVHKKFTFAIIVFIFLLAGGVYFYSYIEGWRYIDSAYFTVATVTTVGYGDIVPVAATARSLVYMEAIFGQFYIAILVAGLVSIHISTKLTDVTQ